MKKLKPFSNGTEAMIWMGNNCDTCRRTGCSKKQSFQRGFISGTITEHVADYVGYTRISNEQVDLNYRCQHYSTIRIAAPQKRQPNTDNDTSLF